MWPFISRRKSTNSEISPQVSPNDTSMSPPSDSVSPVMSSEGHLQANTRANYSDSLSPSNFGRAQRSGSSNNLLSAFSNLNNKLKGSSNNMGSLGNIEGIEHAVKMQLPRTGSYNNLQTERQNDFKTYSLTRWNSPDKPPSSKHGAASTCFPHRSSNDLTAFGREQQNTFNEIKAADRPIYRTTSFATMNDLDSFDSTEDLTTNTSALNLNDSASNLATMNNANSAADPDGIAV